MRERKKALCVGIDDYPGNKLEACVNDATALAELLRTDDNGDPNFRAKTLLSSETTVTRARLRKGMTQLFSGEADYALFYFSGHGFLDENDGYLVTQDAKAYEEGVAMHDLLTMAMNSDIREITIILDCCHSGKFGERPEFKASTIVLREGMSVLTAGGANELALEEHGHGVFTRLVIAALSGGAADVVGEVTAASVYSYVDQILDPWDQRPRFRSHVTTLTPLRTCEPIVKKELLRNLAIYFETRDYVLPLDPSYEPDLLPRDAEKEAIFAQLQKFRAARLLEPIGEEHMYYAAKNSTGCRLTPLGQFYWDLAKKDMI